MLTDNNPLTYIMSKPKLDACEQRWVSKLGPFDFDLKYIPGTQNIPADLLSRRPFARTLEVCEALESKAHHVTLESVQEAFRLSVNVLHQNSEDSAQSVQVGSLSQIRSEGVKAIFEFCLDWESSRPCTWCSADPLCQQVGSWRSGYTLSLFDGGNTGKTES